MGPDTTTTHFSILMAPAPHLNGHYPIFGQVVRTAQHSSLTVYMNHHTDNVCFSHPLFPAVPYYAGTTGAPVRTVNMLHSCCFTVSSHQLAGCLNSSCFSSPLPSPSTQLCALLPTPSSAGVRHRSHGCICWLFCGRLKHIEFHTLPLSCSLLLCPALP